MTEEQKPKKPMNKMQLYSIFYSLIIGVVLLAAAVYALLNYKPVKFAKYENPSFGLSISYPEAWSKVESPGPGAIVAFVVPKEDELAVFNANVNITYVEVKSKKYNNDQIAQMTLQQVGALFDNHITMEFSGPALVAGRTGYKIIFKGRNVANPLQYMNAWAIVGERVYVVTYAATELEFKTHLPEVNRMLSSLKIL